MQYNPYGAPPPPPTPQQADPYASGQQQPWEVGEVLGAAWNGLKQHFVVVFFAIMLGLVISQIPSQVLQRMSHVARHVHF